MYESEAKKVCDDLTSYALNKNVLAEFSYTRSNDMPIIMTLGNYMYTFCDNMVDVIYSMIDHFHEKFVSMEEDLIEAAKQLSEEHNMKIQAAFNYAEPFYDKGGPQEIINYFIIVNDKEPIYIGNYYSGLSEKPDMSDIPTDDLEVGQWGGYFYQQAYRGIKLVLEQNSYL